MNMSIDREMIFDLLILLSAGEKDPDMIDGATCRKRINLFFRQSMLTHKDACKIWLSPEFFLGRFSDVPQPLRLRMSEAAAFFDQEHILSNCAKIRKVLLMPLWKTGNVLLSIGFMIEGKIKNKRKKQNVYFPLLRILKKCFFHFGTVLTKGSLRFFRRLIECIRFTKFYKQPFLYSLWVCLNIDIKELSFSYLEKIPINLHLGPIYRCSEPSVECAAFIGIDLLPSNGKLYFLETNFNAALRPERLLLYKDNDPIGNRLIAHASDLHFKKIIVYGHDVETPFDTATEHVWRKIAQKNSIDLEVIDNLFTPSVTSRSKRIDIAFPTPENTLILLVKAPVNTVLLKLIAEKGNIEPLIENTKSTPRESGSVDVPKRFFPRRDGHQVPRDKRFPNIIAKHKRMDRGSGIKIFNVKTIPKEYFTEDFVVSEYIIPGRFKKFTQGNICEFSYQYRSHILLTADGPVYLGSHKVCSKVAIPTCVQNGMLEDVSPYVMNFSLGGYYEIINDEEDTACEKVSLAVGKVICQFAKEKFVLTIPGH